MFDLSIAVDWLVVAPAVVVRRVCRCLWDQRERVLPCLVMFPVDLDAGWGQVKPHTQCIWHPCSRLLQKAKNPGPSTSVSSWEGNVAKEMSPTSLGLQAFSSLFSKIYIPRSPTSANISETPLGCSLLSVHIFFFSTSYYTIAPLPKIGAQTFVN